MATTSCEKGRSVISRKRKIINGSAAERTERGPRAVVEAARSIIMRYGRTMTFLKGDGSTVQAREFYTKPTDQLAEGFITDDGRVIYCNDEVAKLFWFEDTQEKLRLVSDEPAAS